jgi:mannose-6-phosphate isomerase-like protein (cupin superfamily)
MSAVEIIEHGGLRYAIIVRDARPDGRVKFFTPDDAPLQIGAFNMKGGEEIQPHIHKTVERKLQFTTEVLIIQQGRLQVDFYDPQKNPIDKCELAAGDVILLLEGAHGFRISEDLKMLEIKQGPYAGEMDKERFNRPL